MKVFLIFAVTLSTFITLIRHSNVAFLNEFCTPRTNIVFLKTHKTAGSSIQNIFLRYADRHRLLLVLPLKDNYLGHPHKFQVDMAVPLLPGYTYNILAHHARFNHSSMCQLMPLDTAFVTILREPTALFESLYDYYSLNETFKMNITQFASLNLSIAANRKVLDTRLVNKIGRNQMAFDLGIDVELFDDERAVLRAAHELNQQFHLVMIAEFMEQSLVLLKNQLCWLDDGDVVAFRHNVRTNNFKSRLSADDRRRLRDVNRADYLLYNYFYRRFLEKVEEFGQQRMAVEVDRLRDVTAHMYRHCIAADNVSRSQLAVNYKFQVYSDKVGSFKVRDEVLGDQTCENLAKAEIPYTKELLVKQLAFLKQKNYTTLSQRVF